MDEKIRYFVNGEPQFTDQHKLTVSQILENAGFKPFNQYSLTRDEGNYKYEDYKEEVPIHMDERFTALYLGSTQTS